MAPFIFLHSDEEYFPGKIETFLENTERSRGYITTKEDLGCESCTDPAFLNGE